MSTLARMVQSKHTWYSNQTLSVSHSLGLLIPSGAQLSSGCTSLFLVLFPLLQLLCHQYRVGAPTTPPSLTSASLGGALLLYFSGTSLTPLLWESIFPSFALRCYSVSLSRETAGLANWAPNCISLSTIYRSSLEHLLAEHSLSPSLLTSCFRPFPSLTHPILWHATLA